MWRTARAVGRHGLTTLPPTVCATPRRFEHATGHHDAPSRSPFELSALPAPLQHEFDVEANRLTLQHLFRRRQSGPDAPTVAVKPTWAHTVTWRCAACHRPWDARPVDRLAPQTADHFGCPHCRSARAAQTPCASASVATPLMRAPKRGGDSAVEDDHQERLVADIGDDDDVRNTGVRSLLSAYPSVAAQWDVARNRVPSNRVQDTVSTVPTTSRMAVWWCCPHCTQTWRESVSSRISRFHRGTRRYGDTYIPLCPSCEARGTERRLQIDTSPSHKDQQVVKRTLADDATLLTEADLRPHQDPASISLTAETLLNWTCRHCQHNFQASVANRFLRYERCPQCTGKVRTPYNLLVIQRPDVVQEVAKTISRTALSYVTIHDAKELPFVCRVCLSTYRMSARTRCALPPGALACPKCLLNASQVAHQLAASPSQSAEVATSRHSAKQHGVPRWKARALVRRAGRRERSRDALSIARNELRMRDNSLRD